MKVIDLFNEISNGEKVPKKIKVNDNIYHYDETDCNEFYRYRTMANDLLTDYADLNDEVEIIEEEKKLPEKLEILNANEHSKEMYYENYSKEEISLDIETLQNWVNKLIDYLKSKGDE